jgi:hypothetical protein
MGTYAAENLSTASAADIRKQLDGFTDQIGEIEERTAARQ